jgi:LPXTG-motif cell wall-anchored protein
MRSVRLLVLLTATLLAVLLIAPSAFAGTPTDASAAPTLTVSPSSGPVGTRVTVEGRDCANPGEETVRLVFQSGPSGTTGAVDLGDIPVDSQGRFRTTVTIPAELDPLQGIGGGPTQPGSYAFVTRPPICTAAFTVTAQAPEPPARTVTVTRFSCNSVTVKGSGWEQTEATVEVAVRPEGGESPDDFVAGPTQVQPDEEANIAPTTLRFESTPRDGRYVAVVLVDFIERGESAAFTLTGCGAGALPFTGSSTIPLLAVGLVMVAGGFALVRRTRTI